MELSFLSIQSSKACLPEALPDRQSRLKTGGGGEKPAKFDASAEKSRGRETQQTERTTNQETGADRKGAGGRKPGAAAGVQADRADGRDTAKLDLSVLRQGAEGKQVGLLQRSLNTLGYEGCKSDGKFGQKTAEATRSFQTDNGLKSDGLVGHRETWPTIKAALATRHDGLTRLGEAMGSTNTFNGPMGAELKQLNAVLAEFSDRTMVRGGDEPRLPTLIGRSSGEMIYVNRGSENLGDIGRLFGIPTTVLMASNPDIEKPYLILPGQEIVIPNMIRDRLFRKLPRQLHPADPDGHLAHGSMNPDFVALVNLMIEQLRGEGFDIRVMAGFRTFSEQQERFEQGRTLTGPIVTSLVAGHSWHNYGLAVDIALNDEDGNPAWPEESSLFWQRLGDVAIAHGSFWGGTFGYPSHVEYHPNFGTDEAGYFIENFESHGLEAVWEQLALGMSL